MPRFVTTPAQTTDEPFDMSRGQFYAEQTWQEPFRQLRAEAPVYRVRHSRFGPYWSVASYAHVVEVEADPETYSSELGGIVISDEAIRTRPGFIARDRPVHTAQRRAVMPSFTPSEMSKLSDEIRRRTATVLDGLPMGPVIDWVENVSVEIRAQLLALLLAVPQEDRHRLVFWSDVASDIERLPTPRARVDRVRHMLECTNYFDRIWQDKLCRPRESDLMSTMAHSDGLGQMSASDFMGNMLLLLVGGNDTVRSAMTGLVIALHTHAEQRLRLEGNSALITDAVPELIRWQSPNLHMRRTATRDTVLAGQRIERGDKVVLWYISANRDESVFGADSEDFVIGRAGARRHLAFGYGIHRCIGARLAEMQLRMLMEEMAKRRLRVDIAGVVERSASCFLHGYRSLPVTIGRY